MSKKQFDDSAWIMDGGAFVPLEDDSGIDMQQKVKDGQTLQEIIDSEYQEFLSKRIEGIANGSIEKPYNDSQGNWGRKVDRAKVLTGGSKVGDTSTYGRRSGGTNTQHREGNQ